MTPPFSTLVLETATNRGAAEIGPEPLGPEPDRWIELDPISALPRIDSGRRPSSREVPRVYRCVENGRLVELELSVPAACRGELPPVIVRGGHGSPEQVAAGVVDALRRAGWVPMTSNSGGQR